MKPVLIMMNFIYDSVPASSDFPQYFVVKGSNIGEIGFGFQSLRDFAGLFGEVMDLMV